MNDLTFSTLKLQADDVLIVRTRAPLSQAACNDLELQLRAAYGWKGVLIALGPGEDFAALPEETARDIYDKLHTHFEERPKLVLVR